MVLNWGNGKRFSYKDLPRQMKPRDFCRQWFNASPEDEEERGYRKQCVQLLARVIGLEQDTVERWGAGLDFPKMPSQYENTLSYAITIKEVLEVTGRHSDILDAVLERIQNRQ